ncbi:RBBP8 N-terminal-like protein [Sceloporus undulatus]|uniref:RBBP8 N-terminal-like protein n=1 Tax=Sceloporus undulatus TaxID=8520 RepID=UPI001C4B016C|nr:RBBP8 N-terminal-like protein [Sceloporus undulatus]
MAAENFAEFLNKLREIHEKEVHALQTQLNELTSERSRETQRIEELFAKNHQLREQQKALKENVKVLENRLRAGLCDRCQVTQELAKKKQHEFGKAHFQSLQHIFILTNEMNKLREENKSLKEELKMLGGTEDRPKALKGLLREGNSTPESPLPLLSMRTRKSSTEKTPNQEAEDKYDQSLGQRSSPGMRISPNTILHGDHVFEMSSQKIANQLHGTIALVKPGSRSCLQERDGPGYTTPPHANETPPSPQPDQSPSFEAYLRASKPDYQEIASSYETLKFASRKEQLCLLNQHFALRHLGLRNNSTSKEGGFPHHLLMARDVGGKTSSQDEWEDQATILELPGAVVYMKDRHLENRLQFLNHQEKLHYLLAQQQQQECKVKMEDSLESTQCRLSSPLARVGKELKKERPYLEDSTNGTLGRFLLINREELEHAEKAEAMREYLTEAPLDLSDSRRGRENLKLTSLQQKFTDHEAGSKGRNEESFLQKSCVSSWLQEVKQLHGSKESEQCTTKAQDIVASPNSLPQELPICKSDSCDVQADSETEMPFGAGNEETDQPVDGDYESVKEESESDISESEMTGVCEDESLQGASIKEEHCCITEDNQRSQRKRKRGPESWTKAHKKSVGRRQNGKATEVPAGVHKATKEMPNHSPVFQHNDNEET